MATTTTSYRKETLDVPGATLYYEVRGSGPALLLMPGGPADATTFRRIENDLAQRFSVVAGALNTYSRSIQKEAVTDSELVQVCGDDAEQALTSGSGHEREYH